MPNTMLVFSSCRKFSASEDLLNQCRWPGPGCAFVAMVFDPFVKRPKLEVRAVLSPNTF